MGASFSGVLPSSFLIWGITTETRHTHTHTIIVPCLTVQLEGCLLTTSQSSFCLSSPPLSSTSARQRQVIARHVCGATKRRVCPQRGGLPVRPSQACKGVSQVSSLGQGKAGGRSQTAHGRYPCCHAPPGQNACSRGKG